MISMTDSDIPEEKTDEAIDPKNRGLGRGLGALFEDEEGVYPQVGSEGHTPGSKRLMMGVGELEPGTYQPRRDFHDDTLKELAESIAVHGVLQPLIVRKKSGFDDLYEIIAGERRWRAAQIAQLHEVPVIVHKLDDKACLEIALIENLQREDLNSIDEARGYSDLIEEFGHTQEKLAAIVGKSRSHIANTVRLLSLPSGVCKLVREGKLSAGHARALITAKNPEELAKIIVNQGLSVRETERLVADEGDRPDKAKKQKAEKSVDTLALEEEISNALGMKVAISVKGQSGAMKISFKNLDQLDEVLHRLSHYPGRSQAG